ncbi:peptidyl-prolyl cis-trans isomerase FKBP53 [Pyrus ussuriensis x Pyrus communis]|uniref:FK506-binding protein n=1 Tax=Pyrus ussuriensis x Pyrus communis TaxID=2448454 RepID=A0A5N5F1G7_9ROSA|nr:peptidyl-prolyl cis-trans isomerase FKBP53 [Pyrus ussuriensis x Pyrus communis]
MGFWGIEVKPGKSYEHQSDQFEGRLHISQATLGLGESKGRSIVQCSIGDKSPIFLCSLLPSKNESVPLDLDFEPIDGLVTFSVIGKRSIYLSGYLVEEGEDERDDYGSDSSGEDIADTESESSEYDTDDDNVGFIDDEDFDMYPPSPVPNSGVVIEEIEDDEKPTNGNSQSKRQVKKNQSNDSEKNTNSQQQIVVKENAGDPVLESEDEDGFPISTKQKTNIEKHEAATEQKDSKITEKTKKKKVKDGEAVGSKRKVEDVHQDCQPEGEKKNKKEKKLKEQAKEVNADDNEKQPEVLKSQEHEQKLSNKKSSDVENNSIPGDNLTEGKKKKKKKKKAQESEIKTDTDETAGNLEDQNEPALEQTRGKRSKGKTFPNGLVVEELAMGKPDGKKASSGKKVSVRYIGKLKNGNIFDSNVGGPPFKFRLGLGQVIPGWDVGVNGMRVGDKRRLTIPPEMGYGHKRAGKIPPNSWLVFDVELLGVN